MDAQAKYLKPGGGGIHIKSDGVLDPGVSY